MSHFSVLVTSDGTDEGLSRVLQPYHEYESTGIMDQYVVFVDLTEEAQAEYEGDTADFFIDQDGNLYWPWDHNLANKMRHATDAEVEQITAGTFDSYWTGVGHKSFKVFDFGPGESYERRPYSDKYPTISEFAKDYHSYQHVNGKWGRFTNPNAKWDWWSAGGRWSDLLLLQDGNRADSAVVSDVDWDGMGAARLRKRELFYDNFQRLWAGYADQKLPRLPRRKADRASWWHEWAAKDERGENIRRAFGTIENFYRSRLFNANQDAANGDYWLLSYDDWAGLLGSRDAFLSGVGKEALTYALLHDGRWIQRGEMGWWGMDTPTQEYDYDGLFWQAVRSFDPSVFVTLVDCHI